MDEVHHQHHLVLQARGGTQRAWQQLHVDQATGPEVQVSQDQAKEVLPCLREGTREPQIGHGGDRSGQAESDTALEERLPEIDEEIPKNPERQEAL